MATLTADDRDVRRHPLRELYIARFASGRYHLDPARTYRVNVLVGPKLLGFADLDVVATAADLKKVDTKSFVPLKNGETLPIKFRIERGAVDKDSDGVADWEDNCPTVFNPPLPVKIDVAPDRRHALGLRLRQERLRPAGGRLLPAPLDHLQADRHRPRRRGRRVRVPGRDVPAEGRLPRARHLRPEDGRVLESPARRSRPGRNVRRHRPVPERSRSRRRPASAAAASPTRTPTVTARPTAWTAARPAARRRRPGSAAAACADVGHRSRRRHGLQRRLPRRRREDRGRHLRLRHARLRQRR